MLVHCILYSVLAYVYTVLYVYDAHRGYVCTMYIGCQPHGLYSVQCTLYDILTPYIILCTSCVYVCVFVYFCLNNYYYMSAISVFIRCIIYNVNIY